MKLFSNFKSKQSDVQTEGTNELIDYVFGQKVRSDDARKRTLTPSFRTE